MLRPSIVRVLLSTILLAFTAVVRAQPSPAAETPPLPVAGTNNFYLQYLLDNFPTRVQGYRVWLAQDYDRHFLQIGFNQRMRKRFRFQEDARWMLATWLG